MLAEPSPLRQALGVPEIPDNATVRDSDRYSRGETCLLLYRVCASYVCM